MTNPVILFSVLLDRDHSLSITVNWLLVIILLVIVLIFVCIRRFLLGRHANFEIDTAEMGIGSQKLSFKPNLRDQEIAYKIWVELSTRKIGLPIDLEHDVVVEIYDSWHDFFSITRELIKDIPVNKVKHKSTRKIIDLSIALLNEGLRPHLTKWQARFRRWYDRQLENAKDDADPQAIQAQYGHFDELRQDMIVVNERLIMYRNKMKELVLGLSEEAAAADSPVEPAL